MPALQVEPQTAPVILTETSCQIPERHVEFLCKSCVGQQRRPSKSNKLLPVDVIGDIERLESGEALSLAQLTAHLRALKTALSAEPPADVLRMD